MPQSYPYKAWKGILAATDKVSEFRRQKWLNSQVFLQISTIVYEELHMKP